MTRSAYARSLPERYARGVGGMVGLVGDAPWRLDRRCRDHKLLVGHVFELAEMLGGWDELTPTRRYLVERLAFLRLRLARHEEQVMRGRRGLFSDTEYLQAVNVVIGLVGKLGLRREAKRVPSIAELRQAGGDA